MIQPETLRYFVELTKTSNMSRAAERLGVSQPTLSHSLKRLEEVLGEELFFRSKKGLRLTGAGEQLLAKAQDLQACWDAVTVAVHEEIHEVKGRIRLGCHTAIAQYTLPLFLPKLLEENPHLILALSHGLSRHMTEGVVSGTLDLALAVNPRPHPDLIIKELVRDRVTVWVPTACANPDVLLIEPELAQSQYVMERLRKKGITFKRIIESSSLEVIAQLMSAGTGCAILPERVVQSFSQVKVNAMGDAPVFQDRLCAVFKPEFRKSAKGKTALQALQMAFAGT